MCPVLDALDGFDLDSSYLFLVVLVHVVGHLLVLHGLQLVFGLSALLLGSDLDVKELLLHVDLPLGLLGVIELDLVVKQLVEFGYLSPRPTDTLSLIAVREGRRLVLL